MTVTSEVKVAPSQAARDTATAFMEHFQPPGWRNAVANIPAGNADQGFAVQLLARFEADIRGPGRPIQLEIAEATDREKEMAARWASGAMDAELLDYMRQCCGWPERVVDKPIAGNLSAVLYEMIEGVGQPATRTTTAFGRPLRCVDGQHQLSAMATTGIMACSRCEFSRLMTPEELTHWNSFSGERTNA